MFVAYSEQEKYIRMGWMEAADSDFSWQMIWVVVVGGSGMLGKL